MRRMSGLFRDGPRFSVPDVAQEELFCRFLTPGPFRAGSGLYLCDNDSLAQGITQTVMTESDLKNIPFRIFILFAGIVVQTLGIAMITTAGLGTTPISTLPLVTAEVSGLTFGTTTFLINTVLFAVQWALLRRQFPKRNFLQLPAVFVFSLFIDVAMRAVSFVPLPDYPARAALSLLGNPFLAAGILLTIKSQTIVQPGEGFVLALAVVLKKPFSSLKIANDVGFVAAAAVVGLCFLGTCYGIREATLVSAVLVGLCVRWMRPLFRMDGV